MKINNLSPNVQGALWTLASGFSFVAMTVMIKFMGKNIPVPTMIFWRAIAGLIATLPMTYGKGIEIWKIKRPVAVLFRVSTSAAAFFTSYYAFAVMPLASAQAISFSRTLFITVLAVFVLKEKVAWRRWTAVFVGFAGILIMTRPGQTHIDIGTIAAIASAFFYAFSIVTIKELTKDHNPLTLILYANVFTTLTGIPFLFIEPFMPSIHDMIFLIIMGFFGVLTQIFYVKALSIGEASIMAITDYVRLPLSAVAGFLIFAEIPDAYTIIGAIIVIGATLYISLREMKQKQAEA